jgi:geranylgeranyl pyrophosphate synthase
LRDGEAALHQKYGIPIALNSGDLLLGEGYRMIAECGLESAKIAKMLKVAAEGHKTLCLGQGAELLMEKESTLPSSAQLIDIFKWKTSPAFEVALQLGAICSGADEKICEVLKEFSESLGIAYQIRDDLDDFKEALNSQDSSHLRASLLFALAAESCDDKERELFLYHSHGKISDPELFAIITRLNVEEKAAQLCEHYKNRAIRSLSFLQNRELKSLMRKIITKTILQSK